MRLLGKIFLFSLVASLTYASPNIQTWDSGDGGWQITGYDGPTYGSVAGIDGFLRITGGAADTDPREDLIYTTSGLAGNVDYSGGGLSITFDFYAQSILPTQLDIYLLSGAGVDYEWFYKVTPTSLGWTSIYVPISFSYGTGWYTENGRTTSANFSADLVDIDQIGIRLWYANDTGGQIYGLDNFDVVPEPETWAFLGIAFLSIGYSFREKIDKAMADLMVRVRGC